MAVKRDDLMHGVALTGANVAGNIARGTSKNVKQIEATEAEKLERARTMKTQGKKGCKAQRVNMAFSADNYDFIQVVSKLKGFNLTQFVNFVMDKYREEHADIYEQAKKLQEGL